MATSDVPSPHSHVLLVDSEDATSLYRLHLNEQFRVNATPRVTIASDYIRRMSPALVVTELELEDGSGIDVCRAAKALPVPATVLVTAARSHQVPDALANGCDGVLLKPFPPNLIVARVGRMLRQRSQQLLIAAASRGKPLHFSERVRSLTTGTNRVWPQTHCPHCAHPGVTSFDYASLRRAWYACLECKKVWLGKRQE